MKKIGIFGGTFNPVHRGHVQLAQNYLDALGLDRLMVIPTQQPPHKQPRELASATHRLAICKLAFAPMGERVEVSDLEIRREGKSFTVDTLRQLRQRYPQDRFFLLVGGDMLLTFRQWREWESILGMAVLCTAARQPGEHRALEQAAEQLRGPGRDVRVFSFPVLPLSSTQVRQALREGRPCGELLPQEVLSYITEHHLYRQQ